MNPTHHDLRSYRKKTCLTQHDVADLLGNKDVSQISRYETSPMSPQLEICMLYHLLFDVPLSNFFPAQKEAIRKRLLVRLPNIIDELRCLPVHPETEKKIKFLLNILLTLTSKSL